MSEFEKWYNELPMRKDATDYTSPTHDKYKIGWKAAMELVLEWLEIEEPFEVFTARIKEELKDEPQR